MPLRSGKSRKAVSENIRTEMHEYDKKGKIGTSHPSSRKKAQKQSIAIALSKARKSGAKIPEKKANLYLTKIAEALKEVKEELHEHEKEDEKQEKKTNKYLGKILEHEKHEEKEAAQRVIEDDTKAMIDGQKTEIDAKVKASKFVRQKLRGC